MEQWDGWIGRSERVDDRVDASAAARWHASLDRRAPADGSVAQGFHWCLCLPEAPTARLGPDGHPLRDAESLLPPIPLPRRMWAASRVEFFAAIRPGETTSRATRVANVTRKNGKSGNLAFVELAHEIFTDGVLTVREDQTLVFRDAAEPTAAPVPPPEAASGFDPAPWDAHRMLVPSEALLFRYSALSFNSHRIHYDLPYATSVEGYRGLVVQGPLIATLLLDIAQRCFGDNRLKSFAFRATSPAICGEELHLVLRGVDDAIELGAFAGDGRQILSANAST